MAKITDIQATEILDSRGNPTIETRVVLDDGSVGIAATPSGASVGTYEAVELRDNDEKRFAGMGVLKAIENIHQIISPKLNGMDAHEQSRIDQAMLELDGTDNKAKLGANATLSVSMSVCKAASNSSCTQLFEYVKNLFGSKDSINKIPTPLFNIFNGGKHAGGNVDFQEFILTPSSSKPYHEGLHMGVILYKSLHEILKKNSLSTLIGDEGGFAPTLFENAQAFSYLKQAVQATSYILGTDVFLGLDAASNSFFKDSLYHLKDNTAPLSVGEIIEYYKKLTSEYPFMYLEDGISEDDFASWATLTSQIKSPTIVVGDDLTVTNPKRLETAIEKKAITGILIKLNQIGTVSETIAVVNQAKQAGLKIIVSHRSGETNDDFAADFAVGVSADYVKFGAPARGERVAKYNRLLHIEKEINRQ